MSSDVSNARQMYSRLLMPLSTDETRHMLLPESGPVFRTSSYAFNTAALPKPCRPTIIMRSTYSQY